jgi:KaiC/GvpD/RAD55 family RecA-like ATPase
MSTHELDLRIPGLKTSLGGPLRLIERMPNQASTSVLVRGGPGTGKTSLALHIAVDAADRLGGDVLFASVEMVPEELRALYDGTTGERRLGRHVIDLARPTQATMALDPSSPVVWFGNLDVLEREGSDVYAALENSFVELLGATRSKPSRPLRAVVVDGLSDGYGLGSRAPRSLADGLVKFAAQEGLVLLLVEETNSPDVTHWSFAVDVSLFVMNETGLPPGARELRVEKSRYSAASVGPHLYLMDGDGPRIAPHPSAYGEKRDYGPDDMLNGVISLLWEPRSPMLLGKRLRRERGVFIDLGQPESAPQSERTMTFAWGLWRQPRILLAEAAAFSQLALKELRGSSPREHGEWLYLGDLGTLEVLEPTARGQHLECLATLVATIKSQYHLIRLEDSSSIGLGRAMVRRYRLDGQGEVRFAQP